MNISQLTVGDVYKNYKQLCKVLDIEPQAGNSKKSQLKELERYIDYQKEGYKFVINKIYNEPLPKIDNRINGSNTSIYIEDIERLILDLLGQQGNEGKLFLSRNKLLQELKMINENYSYCRDKTINLSDFMNITVEEINDFYTSSSSTMKSNLETALNRLSRQSLIYWTYALTVCFIDTSIETIDTGAIKAIKREYINELGQLVTDYDTAKPTQRMSYRKATDNEIKIIKGIERDLLLRYDCEDTSDLFKKGLVDKYYKEVKELVFDKTNIIFYYNSYEILYNERHVKSKLNKLRMKQRKKEFTQGLLNASIMDKVIENATNRHDKAVEQILKDEEVKGRIIIRSKKEYIANNEKLSNTLINKDYESLKDHIIKGNKAKIN